jgi:hypothetical protein
MIKKIILVSVVLGFIFMFGGRVFILASGIWDYSNTDKTCREAHLPVGQAQLEGQIPLTMIIFEVTPYSVKTDRGYMYPGDEYEAYGEGAWYGLATLLGVGKKGATFLITYPVDEIGDGYSRKNCRSLIPIGNYD